MKTTIPEIAEMLRHHVNNDNDAPRLIVEHILPLLKVEVDTVQDLLAPLDSEYLLGELADDVAGAIRDLRLHVELTYENVGKPTPNMLTEILADLEAIKGRAE